MKNLSLEQLASPQKVYYLGPRWRTSIAVLAVVAFLLPVFLVIAQVKITGGTIEGVFALFYLPTLIMLFVAHRFRLVISSEGIEYHEPPVVIRAAWADIETIGASPYHTPVLMLHQRAVIDQSRISRFFLAGKPRTGIPLALFMWHWDKGLLDDLRRYAPWLFPDDRAGNLQDERG